MKIETVRSADDAYTIRADGAAVGIIRVWHKRDQVNHTGVKQFRAEVFGQPASPDFDTMAAALTFAKALVTP